MPEPFVLPVKILFQHCDPAGIVFYPRYFEMLNQTVEAWFETAVGTSFAAMHGREGIGVPAVSIHADFLAPSRLGEEVAISLTVTRIGRTSATLRFAGACGGEARFAAGCTMVQIELGTGRPLPWSDPMRTQMARFLEEPAAG